MSKRFCGIIVVVAVGLVAVVCMVARAEDVKQPQGEEPFKRKVVVFALRKDASKLTALQAPQVRRLGDIDFLTGQVVGSSGEDWRFGAVIWVPVADLGELVEFKDLKEAKRVVRLLP